ncbi:MAG: 2-oxo acid dehydrogenase subunit E2 [Haloferacaceae archaeon]
MIHEFRLPDVGEGVAEGELVEWLVEPGDPVTEDQPVAEVETDKALVEIPSPYEGTVHDLHAAPGDVVPVGEVIISFDVPDEGETESGEETAGAPETDEEGRAAETPEPGADDGTARRGDAEGTSTAADERGATGRSGGAVAPPSVRRLARELGVSLDAVAGSGPGGRVTEVDVRTAATEDDATEDDATEDDATEGGEAGGERTGAAATGDAGESEEREEIQERGAITATGTGPTPAERERTLAAPATRRLAEEAGVDIDDVPTDETRDGEPFVTAEQVRAYAATQEVGGPAAAVEGPGATPARRPSEESTPTPAGTAAAEEGRPSGERVPYRGVRRTIGERMERAKFTAPHVTHHDVVDATDLVALREELNEAASVRLTYLPLVTKAVVAGLRAFPYVNAQLDEERGEIVLRDEYNVGVATATDAGLMVPVIADADAKGLETLAREIAERTERARERTIAREELQGGTFTITNVGTIGGEYATPIVNYPEVAVLALGAIRDRPHVVDGEVVARKTLPLSLSVDHRVVDGAVAARFTNHVKALLENPARLLLELE